MAKKKYYNMTKAQLENELEKKQTKISDRHISYINMVLGVTFALICIGLDSTVVLEELLHSGLVAIMLLSIEQVASTINNKIKIKSIKNRLNDVVSMKYEKDRYALDKKYEKEDKNVQSISSLASKKENEYSERIKLLKEYKTQLENYDIYNSSKKIDNELKAFQYTKSSYKALKGYQTKS